MMLNNALHNPVVQAGREEQKNLVLRHKGSLCCLAQKPACIQPDLG
jgi:hypothetical protein